MKKQKFNANAVPKYVSMAYVEKLTDEERAELYIHCVNGRTCYVQDYDYGDDYGEGAFFEDVVDSNGKLK